MRRNERSMTASDADAPPFHVSPVGLDAIQIGHGLARRLSPAQTASKKPERSACAVRSTRSATLTAPSTTARFARISPKERAIGYLPVYLGGRFSRKAVTPSA